jgi:putative DNA primase/helicase
LARHQLGPHVISDLRAIASALGGVVCGGQVLAPGPNPGRRDRSLSVRLSASSPFGFLVHSYAGDPFDVCQRYVADRLGLDPNGWKATDRGRSRPQPRPQTTRPDGNVERTSAALHLWNAGVDPRGTLAERYLTGRGLELEADASGEVLRWNPGCCAMLALFRNIITDEPQAISRTFLDREGRKLERKFLGPVGGAAIKLDSGEEVLSGLHCGEGVETCLAARQLGLRPTWALGSAGAIAAFPIVSGVECLTLLRERDDASKRATEQCAARWHGAGRTVIVNEPSQGKDLNDTIRGRA